MAVRKPKPTAIKELEGNPGKRKLNNKEPKPDKGMTVCSEWLLPEAKAEWKRLSEKLNQMGVLTKVDMAAFAAYCQSYARWKEVQEQNPRWKNNTKNNTVAKSWCEILAT